MMVEKKIRTTLMAIIVMLTPRLDYSFKIRKMV